MNITFFDAHDFEKEFFEKANAQFNFDITYIQAHLNENTIPLVKGPVICCFVNDHLNATILGQLKDRGVRLVALRCAGFNQVDLSAAKALGIKIVRVPEYSPHAVAEHATTLLLAVNRKIHRSFQRVREGNFSLNGLIGFDLYQKTVGVVGTGKIGKVFINIMKGFGCNVIAYDPFPSNDSNLNYVDLNTLITTSDIISLHCPLTKETTHLINQQSISKMKDGVTIINTGRGALIDTQALIEGLKNKKIGGAGLDVYEEEENFFFEDLSSEILNDDHLARLLTFPNVILTGHQAFLTKEALVNIAETTLKNIAVFQSGTPLINEVLKN